MLELSEEVFKVYRDAERLFLVSRTLGGSAYVTRLNTCKVKYKRAQDCKLKKHFLSCEEGDPRRGSART